MRGIEGAIVVEEPFGTTFHNPWRILAAAIVLQTAYSTAEMGLPTITGFIKSDLHLSAATAGLAVTSYLLGKLTCSYAAGRIADRLGESKVLVAGSVGAGLMLVAASASPFPVLFVLLGLAGVAGSASTPAGGSLVRNAFPPSARGVALGLRQTGIPVGGLIAAALLPWIAHLYDWRWSLRVAALVCIVGAVPMARSRSARRVGVRVEAVGARARVVTRELWLLTAWGTAAVMGQFALLIFIPLDLHQRKHLSLASAATFVAVLQVAGIVGRIGWGWLSDRMIRFGRSPFLVLLTAGGALGTLLLFALPASSPLGLWVVATVIAGTSILGFQGIWVTILTEAVPGSVVGTAMGFAITFTLIGGAVAPPLFGAVADATGSYRAVWALLTGAMVLAFIPAIGLVREAGRHG